MWPTRRWASGLSLAYAPRRGLPRSPDAQVGVLITEFRGEQPAGFLEKTLGRGTTARKVTVNGDPAVWISGRPHQILYRTPAARCRRTHCGWPATH